MNFRYFPPILFQETGFYDLLWWQILLLPVLIILSWLFSIVLSTITQYIFGLVVSQTKTDIDDLILSKLSGPIRFFWTLGIIAIAVKNIGLHQQIQSFTYTCLRIGLIVTLFLSIKRSLDVVGQKIITTSFFQTRKLLAVLVPLATKIGNVLFIILGGVMVLAELGYPIGGLLAGLGIGGMALALASQKTIENLFGAFSLALDRPFSEGDFVRIDNSLGTIESIGLRSTKIRTLDRTIITFPNGRLSEMKIESFTARDKMRLHTVIGLVYETTSTQLKSVIDGFENVLKIHPKIWPENIIVRLVEFGASSLNIEIMAWFQTSDWNEFQKIREEILFDFIKVVEEANGRIAYNTHTIFLKNQTTENNFCDPTKQ